MTIILSHNLAVYAIIAIIVILSNTGSWCIKRAFGWETADFGLYVGLFILHIGVIGFLAYTCAHLKG